jgi:hypothetical protein
MGSIERLIGTFGGLIGATGATGASGATPPQFRMRNSSSLSLSESS